MDNNSLSDDEAFAIIRAILCLYSNNIPERLAGSTDEKHVEPLLRKAFGISKEQYDEISKKILEYSPKQITKSELQLRYAWRDNHPMYKSEAFKNLKGHEIWKKAELQEISEMLKETDLSESPVARNKSSHPSIKEIFGQTLKKHTQQFGKNESGDIQQGYLILVKAFVQVSIGSQYNSFDCQPLRESFLPKQKNELVTLGLLPELSFILTEYCQLYGIRQFYRYLVIFDILSSKFDDNFNQLNLLLECFEKLMDIRGMDSEKDTITIQEDAYYNRVSFQLFEILKYRLGKYRFCFSPRSTTNDNSNSIAVALKLLTIINKELEWNVDIQQLLASCIVDCTEKEFTILYENRWSQLKNSNFIEIYTLSKTVQDVVDAIKVDFSYFHPTIKEYGFQHIHNVCETFAKFINSKISIVNQKFSKEAHTQRKGDTMECSPWLSCIFSELVPGLLEFNNLTMQYFGKKLIPLDGDILFFAGKLVLNRIEILNYTISKVFDSETWKPNGKGVLHSTGSVDFFFYLVECFKSIQSVETNLSLTNNPLVRSFASYLDKTFVIYNQAIRSKIILDLNNDGHQKFIATTIESKMSRKIKNTKDYFIELCGNTKFTIPPSNCSLNERMCVQINTFEQSRILLDDFDTSFNYIFKDNLNDIFVAFKKNWKLLIPFYVYKLNFALKPMIQKIAFLKDDITKEKKLLIQFIEDNLAIGYKCLFPNIFTRFLKNLFKIIIININELILPKNFKNWNIKVVDNLNTLVNELTGIFHGNGLGLSKGSIYKDLRRVLKIMELYRFQVPQLIDFHKIILKIEQIQLKPDINNQDTYDSSILKSECVNIMLYFREDKEMDGYLKSLKL
ncbi:hypothetical protein DLAC_08254 [Tieghemostelium lacteum]|uniref:MHD2 domain-containing protein n=1 Tax=Tieghemostelium lacteum TaxID=361077 RepID=A0A151ZBJ3_TIELA|nr:hypothetical protein DLAC_08254 [Tieghemostelium lacteum]|eukprot:KYQ91308.1 hypothetical protein DLAC_08254 [Tieghemostelium lacteum]